MKCKICSREAAEEGYCMLHLKAYRNLMEKFGVWQHAAGVSWSQYLNEIQKNSLTGEWAKEVAKHLMKEEEDVGQN